MQDVMTKNTHELVSALGLHATTCDDLLSQVALSICPEPRSVKESISLKKSETSFLPTGLCAFDETLRGGLPCGGIVEVVGPAGAGKTQFCLQSCVRAIGEWDANSAIYIDTVCLQVKLFPPDSSVKFLMLPSDKLHIPPAAPAASAAFHKSVFSSFLPVFALSFDAVPA
jgi:hypothetical protein